MAKAKKTPAYVKKAIEWLEKNAPDGEQIAFINDQEAAHLKSMGGSGEEVVDSVRSYANPEGSYQFYLDQQERQRQQQQDERNRFVDTIRARVEEEEAARENQEDEEEPYEAPGGAGEIERARQEANILDDPALPTVPQLKTTPLEVSQDQLIDPDKFKVATDPTIGSAEQVSETGLTTAVPEEFTPERFEAAQAGDTGAATAATLDAPSRVIEDEQISETAFRADLAEAATADLDPRATVKFQLEQITSTIKDGEPLPSWAAPAARNVDSIMLQRGLGASSMAASARTQALIEAGLPIASADAQAYGRIQLQNLNNKQQTALQNANNLAAMRTQNLNARMTAAVNNAQNFLAIDTANLSNKQASNTLTYNAYLQKLFADQAATNAARQFNATTTNQIEQFFSTLENSVNESNANRLQAVRQFNVGEANAQEQFIENQRATRESFNVQMASQIEAANANWRQSVATVNYSNQKQANIFAAQSVLGLRTRQYNDLLQKRRDEAHFIYESTERALDREAQAAALAQQAAIARSNRNAEQDSNFFTDVIDIVRDFF